MAFISQRRLALFGLAACLLALAVALGAEHFLGVVPCAFCLLERKPYYAGIIVAAGAILVTGRLQRILLWLLLALFAVAAVLSFVHVGVELHAWPDPLPECTVPDYAGMTNVAANRRHACTPGEALRIPRLPRARPSGFDGADGFPLRPSSLRRPRHLDAAKQETQYMTDLPGKP